MSKLLFTVSPARGGKSTFAKKWKSEGPNRVVVSGDQIRLALHGCRYSSWAEGFVFAIQQVMIRTLLNSGHDVLVDDTHTTKESCIRLLEIDPNAEPCYLGNDPELCKKRALATNQPDLLRVIDLHSDNLNRIVEKYGSYDIMLECCRAEIKKRWNSDNLCNIVIKE